MPTLRMQPTFRVTAPHAPAELIRRMREAITDPALGGEVAAAGSCFDFRVAPAERRLWSPHLSVQVGPDEAGAELFGRFSPRPEVWTLVMMLYFFAAFIATCGAIYGCVQGLLGATPWALLATPAGLVAIVALHVVSLAGQRLSADQMVELRERFDRSVRDALLDRALETTTTA